MTAEGLEALEPDERCKELTRMFIEELAELGKKEA